LGKKERIERVISERVVGERVLGSANPIAKGFRGAKNEIVGAFQGIGLGIILFFVAIGVSTCEAKAVSKDAAKYEAVSAEDAAGKSGMFIVTGAAELVDKIKPPQVDTNVLYYSWERQEYCKEIVTETHTETVTENGQEVEKTVEEQKEVWDWKTREERAKFAVFKLGAIKVKPDGAVIDLTKQTIEKDMGKNSVGNDIREVVEYVELPSRLTIIGNVSGGEITGGITYRITEKNKDEIIAQMKAEEKAQNIGYFVLAVILFTLSFNLVLGPILLLTKIVPFVGGMIRGVVFFVSLIISVVIVLMIKIVLMFWWLLLLIMLLGVAVAIAIALSHKEKHVDTESVNP
jgi:hypothetical protein